VISGDPSGDIQEAYPAAGSWVFMTF